MELDLDGKRIIKQSTFNNGLIGGLYFNTRIKKTITIMFVLSSMSMFIGCGIGSLKKQIALYLDHACHDSDSCIIYLNNVTSFKWDKMYIFANGVSLQEINNTIGFSYPYFEDLGNHIIFILGDSTIVYHEDEYIDPDVKFRGAVHFFHYEDTVTNSFLTPQTAFT